MRIKGLQLATDSRAFLNSADQRGGRAATPLLSVCGIIRLVAGRVPARNALIGKGLSRARA